MGKKGARKQRVGSGGSLAECSRRMHEGSETVEAARSESKMCASGEEARRNEENEENKKKEKGKKSVAHVRGRSALSHGANLFTCCRARDLTMSSVSGMGAAAVASKSGTGVLAPALRPPRSFFD